jgi:hypothetical protein
MADRSAAGTCPGTGSAGGDSAVGNAPGRGRRFSLRGGEQTTTVEGPSPCVCFTEVPLGHVLQSFGFADRYSSYGIAVNRVDLYAMGGRPVIYGNDNDGLLDELPERHKYRWVCLKPLKLGTDDYPRDFTWEREWRMVPRDPAVGLRLRSFVRMGGSPPFWVLVRSDVEVPAFRELLDRAELGNARVASLDTVMRRIRSCGSRTEPTSQAEPPGRIEEFDQSADAVDDT